MSRIHFMQQNGPPFPWLFPHPGKTSHQWYEVEGDKLKCDQAYFISYVGISGFSTIYSRHPYSLDILSPKLKAQRLSTTILIVPCCLTIPELSFAVQILIIVASQIAVCLFVLLNVDFISQIKDSMAFYHDLNCPLLSYSVQYRSCHNFLMLSSCSL